MKCTNFWATILKVKNCKLQFADNIIMHASHSVDSYSMSSQKVTSISLIYPSVLGILSLSSCFACHSKAIIFGPAKNCAASPQFSFALIHVKAKTWGCLQFLPREPPAQRIVREFTQNDGQDLYRNLLFFQNDLFSTTNN